MPLIDCGTWEGGPCISPGQTHRSANSGDMRVDKVTLASLHVPCGSVGEVNTPSPFRSLPPVACGRTGPRNRRAGDLALYLPNCSRNSAGLGGVDAGELAPGP